MLPSLPRRGRRRCQVALLALASVPAASLLMFVRAARCRRRPALVVALFLGTAVRAGHAWTIATHHTATRPRALSFLVAAHRRWSSSSTSGSARRCPSTACSATRRSSARATTASATRAPACSSAAVAHRLRRCCSTRTRAPALGPRACGRVGLPGAGRRRACVTAAAPFLGANIGVAVWGDVRVRARVVGDDGRKVDWRLVRRRAARRRAARRRVRGDRPACARRAQTHLGRSLPAAGAGRPGPARDDRRAQGGDERPRAALDQLEPGCSSRSSAALAYVRVAAPGRLPRHADRAGPTSRPRSRRVAGRGVHRVLHRGLRHRRAGAAAAVPDGRRGLPDAVAAHLAEAEPE